MSQVSRRSFLKYVGVGAGAVGAGQMLGPLGCAGSGKTSAGAWVSGSGMPEWEAVGYPIPLPGDGGSAARDSARFAKYVVRDELVLPKGFTYDVLAQWGEEMGAAGQRFGFGFNADYTGLTPVQGRSGEFWLIVNHEYISARPWLEGFEAVFGEKLVGADGKIAGLPTAAAGAAPATAPAPVDAKVIAVLRRLCERAMGDLGVSVVKVKSDGAGRLRVVKEDGGNFRIAGASSVNAREMGFTGPAAGLVGKQARGTFSNCSGAVTPWGTFLTCEENFQDQVAEFVTPGGAPLSADKKHVRGIGDATGHELPFEFEGLGTGLERPLDGREYGWVCEVDPVKRTMKKHTALGRFRHENVALRVEAEKKLVAYLGDDRRGGHVWKFVSEGVVKDPKDPRNSALLEQGTLYVAKFEADFSGRWIAVEEGTRLARPEPEVCASGHVWLPWRSETNPGGHVAVGVEEYVGEKLSVEEWVKSVEKFAGKAFDALVLGDLVRGPMKAGVLRMDAYVMGNAAGGTPCSRPEDVEVHAGDGSVYIAFTDSTGSGDGSPDKRIFPDSAGANSRQYGAIYRIVEDGNDPAATTFGWGKFVSSGEASEGGGGFACADNLAFDGQGNLWMVCDITTAAHNSAVDRMGATAPGGKNFVGVFGNNAMFMIPTRGKRAGAPHCFAIGPMECEITGPTFAEDGKALIVAIQHPGELHGARGLGKKKREMVREMKIAGRDGKVFVQQRTVPLGSNFPSKKLGEVPRPCVVVIRRER